MSGLRFCFLTTFYPPYSLGGDGIAVQRLARALVARGSSVTVVHDVNAFRALHSGAEPKPARCDEPGLTVVPLVTALGRLSLLLTHQLGRPVIHGRRIRRILREGQFDILVFHNISLLGGPGLLSYGGKTPKMYMAHEHWLVCPSHTLWRHNRELCDARQCIRCTLRYRRPPQLWRWTGYLDRQAAHVHTFLALSDFSRQKHREFGFRREMEVLPPFLPPLPLQSGPGTSPHDRPYFLFVGRLERLKGLDSVIAAFRRYEGADLLIAGDGQHEASLKHVAMGIDRVKFLGRVERDELDLYYRHALALIVPSVGYETFGLTILEAFRQSTPVIARRIGPFPEIVEQSGGGDLFSTEDELIAAMQKLQSDAPFRTTRGNAAHAAYADRWTDDVVVPQFLDSANRLIELRGAAAL